MNKMPLLIALLLFSSCSSVRYIVDVANVRKDKAEVFYRVRKVEGGKDVGNTEYVFSEPPIIHEDEDGLHLIGKINIKNELFLYAYLDEDLNLKSICPKESYPLRELKGKNDPAQCRLSLEQTEIKPKRGKMPPAGERSRIRISALDNDMRAVDSTSFLFPLMGTPNYYPKDEWPHFIGGIVVKMYDGIIYVCLDGGLNFKFICPLETYPWGGLKVKNGILIYRESNMYFGAIDTLGRTVFNHTKNLVYYIDKDRLGAISGEGDLQESIYEQVSVEVYDIGTREYEKTFSLMTPKVAQSFDIQFFPGYRNIFPYPDSSIAKSLIEDEWYPKSARDFFLALHYATNLQFSKAIELFSILAEDQDETIRQAAEYNISSLNKFMLQ